MEREGSVHEEDPSCSKGWTRRKKRSNISGTRDRMKGFAPEWLGWGLPMLSCAMDLIICAVTPDVVFSVKLFSFVFETETLC